MINRSRNNCVSIRERNERLVIDQGEVKIRWGKYFADLLMVRAQ